VENSFVIVWSQLVEDDFEFVEESDLLLVRLDKFNLPSFDGEQATNNKRVIVYIYNFNDSPILME
jgi:hypothetical protein